MNINVLPGFQELLPKKQIAFNRIKKIIEDIYQLYGFRPIETPILEREEILLLKGGGETDKQMYRFKKGDTNLAMRFDLTVPLARYVAKNQNDLVFPFKRYAIDRVYRGEKPQKGRFREFYQCDIDVIGRDILDYSYDTEILSIIAKIFSSLNLDFLIEINNRKILIGIFEFLKIENSFSVLKILDSIKKEDTLKLEKKLKQINLNKKQIETILSFTKLNSYSNQEIINYLKSLNISSNTFKKGVEELELIMKESKILSIDRWIKIDLTLARGLDYYTGTIYEILLNKYPDMGSVGGGGRYENLVDGFTNQRFPGVGISIGLTRLFDLLDKKGEIETDNETYTKVLLLSLLDNRDKCLELANTLRQNNISTEIAPIGNIKKALNYANKLKIPYVIFIGEEEIKDKVYTIKNMTTGEQKKLSKENILKLFN